MSFDLNELEDDEFVFFKEEKPTFIFQNDFAVSKEEDLFGEGQDVDCIPTQATTKEKINEKPKKMFIVAKVIGRKKDQGGSPLRRSLRGYVHKLIYTIFEHLLSGSNIHSTGTEFILNKKQNENYSRAVYGLYTSMKLKDFIGKLNELSIPLIDKLTACMDEPLMKDLKVFLEMRYDDFFKDVFLGSHEEVEDMFSMESMETLMLFNDYYKAEYIKSIVKAEKLKREATQFLLFYKQQYPHWPSRFKKGNGHKKTKKVCYVNRSNQR